MPSSTPNFRFKQFSVTQRNAAMKVGFDGILLGAWSRVSGSQNILDVGTGTGLVALMAAQRTASVGTLIDGIESDQRAAFDASVNFAESQWSNRLKLIRARLQDWCPRCEHKYDLVMCNPPYFQGHNAQNLSRQLARHDVDLSLSDLVEIAKQLLKPGGRLVTITPTERWEEIVHLANAQSLFANRQLLVRSLPKKPGHRVLGEFSDSARRTEIEEIVIETRHHEYSEEFRNLTADFYLKF